MGDSVQTSARLAPRGEQPAIADAAQQDIAAEPDTAPAATRAEQDSVAEDPLQEEPVMQEAAAEQPAEESPAVENPATENPQVEEPVAAEPEPDQVAAANTAPPQPQNRLLEFRDKLLAGGAFLWDNKAWVLLILLFALFVYFNLTRARPSTEDVPALWNTSIKKLGVEPIYPPQEGVMVGDVYLIVAPVREEVRGFLPDYFSDTFAGRSIKVGQIDLVQSVLAAQTRFSLPKTKFLDTGEPGNEQDGLLEDVASDQTTKIRLYDIVFPKVVIDRNTDSNAAAKWFTAAFSDNVKDSISFNKVQTFAAPSLPAMLQLQVFCKTMQFCENDKAARTLLSYALGSSINQTYRSTDGIDRYVFDIEVFVVTQVFATRRITVDNNVGWSDDLNANFLPDRKAQDATQTETDTSGADTDANGAGQQEDGGGRLGYKRTAGTGLSIDASFQRPVVFAYRKAAILLPREKPVQTPK